MMPSKWVEVKADRARRPSVQAGYMRARSAYRLAERVRLLREARGVSQGDLAQLMGTTQSAVARLEAGGTYPNFQTLERVGRALRAELVVEFRDVLPTQKSLIGGATRFARVSRNRSRGFVRREVGTRMRAKKTAKRR